MTLVEISLAIDDAAIQPRIDDCYDTGEKPPRTAELIRDLVREGSLNDLFGDAFFAPIVTVRVDGEPLAAT